ncbi:hypothetical protein LTR62_003828 [Meristemomyces frigidus]|uniref:Heme haloperoxidase family profile domain-containing protein n=1 Tax=Meristemomyces frigidus TaxID=1508187 RepID=A0AAN7TIW8_9PEZI|nr:hypothetical protein LTR62_003828 [Meristemomyces frigidus]
MKTAYALAGLPALALAFPGMMGVNSREEALQQLKETRMAEQAEKEKRQVLGGLLGSLTGTVGGVINDLTGAVGSVTEALNPDNKRPEPGYTFQAPGPNDSRGPCPGLNLLANYGYLPRNGHVNYGQVVEATARGFNMGLDLATVLAVFAILTDGDIPSQSWYLGTGPSNVGGLNRHDTVEADISPNREDYYLGCGNNHALSSRIFTQNVQFASQDPNKEFSLNAMGNQWAANGAFSVKNNPYLYLFPFPSIVSIAAYNFYPQFFSNGTYGAGGVANYESIASIIGAQFDEKTQQFEYVPERWPENWYRRATEYDAVQALTDGFTIIYPHNPIPMVFPQLANVQNLTPQDILCVIYEGITSITPLFLGGTVESGANAITSLVSLLDSAGLSNTTLGCPASAESQNGASLLYPNASQKGGPLNLPPTASDGNAGNNVYNKVYFTKAPTTPQCNNQASGVNP